AGGANGLVYALTGAGAVEAVALGAGGAVDSVAISDDGATLVAGGEDMMVHVFDVAPAPAPLPLAVLVPAWSWHAPAAMTLVYVTGDGLWVEAAAGSLATVWMFSNPQPSPVPGDLRTDTCALGPVPTSCWTFRQSSAGQLSILTGARRSYDLVIGYTTGFLIATSASNFFTNPWNFQMAGAPAAAMMSADGSRVAGGDTFGNLYYMGTGAIGPYGGGFQPAIWHYAFPSGDKVGSVAISADGARVAAADVDGNVAFFEAATSGTPVWTYAAGASVAGLAFEPDGAALAGASGTTALFWS
ncbi:MAG: hypothetical protein ACYDCK_06900, partial [Thermoplasmatota archaeon]